MRELALAGPGYISKRFLEGSKYLKDAKVSVIVSRHPENIREYAASFEIEKVLNYDEFLQDETICCVYVCTPTPSHFEVVRNCLLNGKNVLCEKPLCLSPAQEEELFALAQKNGLLLMEAYKALFVPPYQKFRELLQKNAIGKIHYVTASFCRTSDISRLPESFGRDYVYDLGCYPVSYLLSLFPAEIRTVHHHEESINGNVLSSLISIVNSDGLIMEARSSLNYTDEGITIYGENGKICCPQFWRGREIRLQTENSTETFRFAYESEFTFEAQHFIDLISAKKTESDLSSPELSLLTARVLSSDI